MTCDHGIRLDAFCADCEVGWAAANVDTWDDVFASSASRSHRQMRRVLTLGTLMVALAAAIAWRVTR